MTPSEEKAYLRGRQSAYRSLLIDGARELEGPERELAGMLSERSSALEALRILAADLGLDVEIDDDLHLADNIEKRLGRALRTKLEDGE